MGARESLVDCQPWKSGTNDYAKFERGGGGGGGGKQIMAMLKWYFFLKMLAYRFCIDERKRRS